MIVYYEVINGITWSVVLNELGEVLYRKRVDKNPRPKKKRPALQRA